MIVIYNKELPEKFNFCFSRDFASNDKFFILAGGLSTKQQFYEVLRFSCYFLISRDPKS